MNSFSGKTAVVTGAASGIGEATAKMLASAGADVIIVDLDLESCERVAAEITGGGAKAAVVVGDLREPETVDNVLSTALARSGRVDVLVNSAGVGELKPTQAVTSDDWRRTLSVNLDATFFMSQAVLGVMRDQRSGAIVNIASIHGVVGFPAHAAYSASKGAIVNLTKSLALEYAKEGIRVNAVCPGFVRTPMIAAGVTDDLMPAIVAMHPIGRIGEPEEIARAVMFLASEDASFITGTHLLVDGGYTAQ